MAGIVFAKFTTPTSRAETIIFRWGGDWILWYFRYLRHSVSARMLWSPCEMELYIWSWEWQTSGSSGGTIKSWARILELNNFDIDVHCFHNVLKNTYCVFKHNLANPTTHQRWSLPNIVLSDIVSHRCHNCQTLENLFPIWTLDSCVRSIVLSLLTFSHIGFSTVWGFQSSNTFCGK